VILEELRRSYDAVFLGIGVGLARRLEIPGEELEGVVDAIRFIYDIRTDGYPSVPVGDKVAVIGMGMTAIDAATQARRLGAGEVTMLYRRTAREMSCTKAELDLAMLDGCRVMWLTAPAAVVGAGGRVSGLVCRRIRLGEPDSSGRRMPVPTGEEIILEVDMVIKATGQMPYEELMTPEFSRADEGVAPVFAGGDCVNGGKEVVDAVQAGKEAAAAILKYFGILQVK